MISCGDACFCLLQTCRAQCLWRARLNTLRKPHLTHTLSFACSCTFGSVLLRMRLLASQCSCYTLLRCLSLAEGHSLCA